MTDQDDEPISLEEEPSTPQMLAYAAPKRAKRLAVNRYDLLTLASAALLLAARVVRMRAESGLPPSEYRWGEGWARHEELYWREHYPVGLTLALVGVGAAAAVAGAVRGRGLRMWAIMAAVVHVMWFGIVFWWWRTQ